MPNIPVPLGRYIKPIYTYESNEDNSDGSSYIRPPTIMIPNWPQNLSYVFISSWPDDDSGVNLKPSVVRSFSEEPHSVPT